jgi:hypothetical protein
VLWSSSDKNPETSALVLRVLSECGRTYAGTFIKFDQLQPTLIPFFWTTVDDDTASASNATSDRITISAPKQRAVFGPFFRLAAKPNGMALQQRAIELLFYFRRFTKPLLRARLSRNWAII